MIRSQNFPQVLEVTFFAALRNKNIKIYFFDFPILWKKRDSPKAP